MLSSRADDAAAFAQRRDEAQRREHPRAGRDRGAADDLVEALPRQHGQRAGHVDPAAARADAAERRRRAAPRPAPRPSRRGGRGRAAHRRSGRRRRPCRAGRRAGRPAARRGRRAPATARAALPAGPAPTTSTSQRAGSSPRPRFIRRRSAPRPAAGPGRIRAAATTAQAVIAPTSAKVSWYAASGAPGWVRSRHSRTLPTRPMPTAPPSWRRKLIVLEPCEMKMSGRPRIEPRLSEGMTKPRPIRPITAQSMISTSAVPRSTVSIRKNDAESSSRPKHTSQLTFTRSASRPANGIVTARAMPGRQQHRAGLRRRQVQRRLHEHRHQVGRAEQRHAVDEGDQAAHRERPVREQAERHQRPGAAALVGDEGDGGDEAQADQRQAERPRLGIEVDHAVEQRQHRDRDQAEADDSRAGRPRDRSARRRARRSAGSGAPSPSRSGRTA